MNVSLAILGKWCLQLAHGGFALAWEIRGRIGNKVLTLAHRPPISQRFACARVPYTRHAQIWVCRRVGLHTKGCEQCRLAFSLQHSFPHRPRGRRCIGPSRGTLAPLAPRAALMVAEASNQNLRGSVRRHSRAGEQGFPVATLLPTPRDLRYALRFLWRLKLPRNK